MRRSRWFWAVIVAAVGAVDVAVLIATGNGNSGKHDSSGQIIGFWIFVLCVLTLVTLAVVTGVGLWHKRRAA